MKILGFSLKRNYAANGVCIQCPECGSEKLNEITRDSIDSYPCEVETVCAKCGLTVNYWAYGNFDPCFRLYDRSVPALFNRICCRIKGVDTP